MRESDSLGPLTADTFLTKFGLEVTTEVLYVDLVYGKVEARLGHGRAASDFSGFVPDFVSLCCRYFLDWNVPLCI